MLHPRALAALAVIPAMAAVVIVASCQSTLTQQARSGGGEVTLRGGDPAHEFEVMKSAFCASCHPAIYAEHEQNTHGRAFTDEEVRLATGRFDHGDCIRCHTPRPVFETGIGMNPIRRHHNLEEGNTCMTCHFKPGHDYSTFTGGAECIEAFDPRVGEVEACASCHRNHGTPYQWELAPTGKQKGRRCIDCHMERVLRPVAVGEAPRRVRAHVFPGCRSEQQLRRAYGYEAAVEGNEAVVRVTNKGAGHNFPTELKQRSVESLIIVRDADGAEVARSRMVFRDPYKRPYGLSLPVNTQIPAGQTREHRVPLTVADGTVETELHFKLYYPIEDHHPDLARRLETRRLTFAGIEPSTDVVESVPDIAVVVPEGITPREASHANLIDFARPPIGTVRIDIPDGDDPAAIAKLIELFQFPVPEGNVLAQQRLAEIGAPALPALVEAMGSWDNKTWNQAMAVLAKIGAPAEASVLGALRSDQLYVRLHARQLLPKLAFGGQRDALIAALEDGLDAPHPLDRASSAEALGLRGATGSAPRLRPLLADRDPDVVRAAALALARLDDRAAAPAVAAALARAYFPETKRDLAEAAALLGSTAGIPVLLTGLDHADDLIRESFFESLFAVTGLHLGYDPLMPRDQRLEAIAALQALWARSGGPERLRRPHRPSPARHGQAWGLVQKLGDDGGGEPDRQRVEQLIAMGDDAVPALVLGLKYPAGFDAKRALLCEALGRIGSRDAAPALAAALRDPVLAVAAWACWALERVDDPATDGAVLRYHDRLLSLAAAGSIPASAGPVDRLLAQAARTRLFLGDSAARNDLEALLLSADDYARELAGTALEADPTARRGTR